MTETGAWFCCANMNWSGSIESNNYYSDEDRKAMKENVVILVNGDKYIHTEDRISQYVL